MEITQSLLTESDCYQTNRTIVPKGIMVHSTATPGVRAAVFIERWNRPGIDKCVHAFLDDTGIYQTLPWEHRGWHCGGAANNTHISMELCEPVDLTDKDYFQMIWGKATGLCAALCREFDLSAESIIDHSGGHQLGIASNHADVSHWFPRFGKSMDDFREATAKLLEDELDMTIDEARNKLTTVAETGEEHSDWATSAVKKMMDAEVFNGDGEGNYGWGQCITREAVAKVLYNMLDKLNLLDQLK